MFETQRVMTKMVVSILGGKVAILGVSLPPPMIQSQILHTPSTSKYHHTLISRNVCFPQDVTYSC